MISGTNDLKGRKNSNVIQLVIAITAVAGLIISIIALFLPQPPSYPKCWKLKEKADNSFDLGEYEKSVELYDIILENCDPASYHILTLKYKGFALLNLGINNETAKIVRVSPITSAENVIEHSLTYIPTNDSRECFNMALFCFKTLYDETGAFEYVFYEGITYLYLGEERKSIKCFNKTITIINEYSYKERGRIYNDIISSAQYGMQIAHQKMREEEKQKTYSIKQMKQNKRGEVQNSTVASQPCPSGHITACLRFAPLTQMPSALRKHANRYMKSWVYGLKETGRIRWRPR